MKINWAVRFKNPTFVVSLLVIVIGFVYQLLDSFGVTPHVEQKVLIDFVMGIAAVIGVTIDPTTTGLSDSNRALGYDTPSDDH